MLQNRTCRECDRSFEGGPRAYYCPSCRNERTRITNAAYRKRKLTGEVRHIGSKDKCERCDKEYTVIAGLQRFCPDCQSIHAIEYDRETALPFYHENKDRINPPRKLNRRKRSDECVICGTKFDPVNGSNTCSDDCKLKLAKTYAKTYREKIKAKNERGDIHE